MSDKKMTVLQDFGVGEEGVPKRAWVVIGATSEEVVNLLNANKDQCYYPTYSPNYPVLNGIGAVRILEAYGCKVVEMDTIVLVEPWDGIWEYKL